MASSTTPDNSSLDEHAEHASDDFAMGIPWFLVCLFTLGFPAKYRERLHLFEDLYKPVISTEVRYVPWAGKPTYSDRGEANGQKTMRQKQQEEWDRLNIAVSVITATSAAALAIQATSNNTRIYWLVTSFYSVAFGLSLEGLILITYMTISAGGSSDEAITLIARGELVLSRRPVDSSQLRKQSSPFVKGVMIKLAALIMALPAILATYSSIYLLLGLVAMVIAGPGEGVDTRDKEYILVTIIPVGVGFLFLCTAIVLCEMGSWTEIWGRRAAKSRGLNSTGQGAAGAQPATPSVTQVNSDPVATKIVHRASGATSQPLLTHSSGANDTRV